MSRFVLLALLPFAATLACQPAVSGPSDSGQTVTDAGTLDSAPIDDAAQTGQDRAVNDAGQTNPDVMAFDFGGYDISEFDAGFVEYDGGQEPGVICGESTCDETQLCCAGFSSACNPADQACGLFTIAVPCDGPEDCTDSDVCCLTGTSAQDYQVSCTDEGTCQSTGTKICTVSEECPDGQICCSAETFQSLGMEIGWCKEGPC